MSDHTINVDVVGIVHLELMTADALQALIIVKYAQIQMFEEPIDKQHNVGYTTELEMWGNGVTVNSILFLRP